MNWLWVAAFLLTFLECSVAARYTRHVVGHERLKAANWGTVFEALLLVDMLFIYTDRWLAVPIMAGAWLGIFLTVGRKAN